MSSAHHHKRINGVRFVAVDRFLLPKDVPEIKRYFLERLFVSHGLRERLSRKLKLPVSIDRINAPPAQGTEPGHLPEAEDLISQLDMARDEVRDPWIPGLDLLRSVLSFSEVFHQMGWTDLPLHRTILLRDYTGSGRARLILFPFLDGASQPSAVIKLRSRAGAGKPLREELRGLLWVQRNLEEPPVLTSIPDVLGFGETEHAELLALSHLSGRSVYWDQQNRFLPGRYALTHLTAAAVWLADFHVSCGVDATAESGPAHGDFWARNILLDGPFFSGESRTTKVVDWESFDPNGSPPHDLFQFPLTYVQNHPWHRHRRVPLPLAFRRGFLDRTAVSRAVGRYFAAYSLSTGTETRDLEVLLRHHLVARAQECDSDRGAQWMACLDLLGSSSSAISRCDH